MTSSLLLGIYKTSDAGDAEAPAAVAVPANARGACSLRNPGASKWTVKEQPGHNARGDRRRRRRYPLVGEQRRGAAAAALEPIQTA